MNDQAVAAKNADPVSQKLAEIQSILEKFSFEKKKSSLSGVTSSAPEGSKTVGNNREPAQ